MVDVGAQWGWSIVPNGAGCVAPNGAEELPNGAGMCPMGLEALLPSEVEPNGVEGLFLLNMWNRCNIWGWQLVKLKIQFFF